MKTNATRLAALEAARAPVRALIEKEILALVQDSLAISSSSQDDTLCAWRRVPGLESVHVTENRVQLSTDSSLRQMLYALERARERAATYAGEHEGRCQEARKEILACASYVVEHAS
jgi:hypothetical protein